MAANTSILNATLQSTVLTLEGMSCASCANVIERAVTQVSGVVNAQVNFAAEQATVDYDARKTSPAYIQKAVTASGYQASELKRNWLDAATVAADLDQTNSYQTARQSRFIQRLPDWLANLAQQGNCQQQRRQPFNDRDAADDAGDNAAALALLFLHHPWVQFALATPVVFWCGAVILCRGHGRR